MADAPRSVGLLGAGVIGGGWAARFVLAGVDVRLFDPSPAASEAVFEIVERARQAWRRLTLAPLPEEGTLTLVDSVAAAVAGVDLVQESAPEREELKRALLAEASAAAPPDAIIATSTSGLLPSRLAADMHGPERFVVGHPFNPVYLLPLVEVCAAERTAPETVARAAAIYRSVAMRPLIVRHEIDGFIADRLLEALWREALWLVADDVATVEEIDDAIRYGAGLRWAAMGTFLTYRLAGGDAGMRHFMAQFGPALQLPWTHLTDVPELSDRAPGQDRGPVGRPGRRPLDRRARARPRRLPGRRAAGSERRGLCRRRGGGADRARAVSSGREPGPAARHCPTGGCGCTRRSWSPPGSTTTAT